MQRRYTGAAGRIENARVGVFLGYAGQPGRALIDRALIDRALIDRALIDRALYVGQDWAGDDARRRDARISDDVKLVTKPKQGLAVLEHARTAGVPFAWIAGDSV